MKFLSMIDTVMPYVIAGTAALTISNVSTCSYSELTTKSPPIYLGDRTGDGIEDKIYPLRTWDTNLNIFSFPLTMRVDIEERIAVGLRDGEGSTIYVPQWTINKYQK